MLLISKKLDFLSLVKLGRTSKKLKEIVESKWLLNWEKFEFICERKGAAGPDGLEIINYYEKR